MLQVELLLLQLHQLVLAILTSAADTNSCQAWAVVHLQRLRPVKRSNKLAKMTIIIITAWVFIINTVYFWGWSRQLLFSSNISSGANSLAYSMPIQTATLDKLPRPPRHRVQSCEPLQRNLTLRQSPKTVDLPSTVISILPEGSKSSKPSLPSILSF